MKNDNKFLLIINPNSGTRSKEGVPDMISSQLPAGTSLEIVFTSSPGDAGKFATEASDMGFSSVIVAGGDGTVSDVASALIGSSTRMAIIPCGSGNGLARSLAIPQDFRKAAEIAVKGIPVSIDCGMANDQPFFCTFGMGFDAAVTQKFSQEKRRGKMSYIKSALIEFLTFQPKVYGISVEGNILTERAMIVAICNAAQYGNNAYIAPKASLTDGLLDVTIIHDGSRLIQAVAGIQLLSGQLDKNILVDTFRISSAEISRLDNSPAHIDGELFYPGRTISIQCRPACVTIMASPDIDRPFKPLSTPIRQFFQDLGTDLRSALGND